MPIAPPASSAAMSPNGVPTNPINFLVAAAQMSKNGELPGAATPQRSMPKGQSTTMPALRKPRKNIRIIK